MDITSLCTGPAPSADELAVVAEFIESTNAADLTRLAKLFAPDAQVNDQLRNFWGLDEIASWLDREIVGEKVALTALGVRKHYDAVIVHAEIRGNFETARLLEPMLIDLHFTVKASRLIRLLLLLARNDSQEPDIRRSS